MVDDDGHEAAEGAEDSSGVEPAGSGGGGAGRGGVGGERAAGTVPRTDDDVLKSTQKSTQQVNEIFFLIIFSCIIYLSAFINSLCHVILEKKRKRALGPGAWPCAVCGLYNKAFRTQCVRCHQLDHNRTCGQFFHDETLYKIVQWFMNCFAVALLRGTASGGMGGWKRGRGRGGDRVREGGRGAKPGGGGGVPGSEGGRVPEDGARK